MLLNLLGFGLCVVLPLAVVCWLLKAVVEEYRGDRVPILVYHRLISREAVLAGRVKDDEPVYASYDSSFAAQMQYLKEADYTTLDLDDYCAIRFGTSPMPSKPIIITFDDGYISNYTMAYPVLRSLGQKATIFVVPAPNQYSLQCIEGLDEFLVPDQMREMAGEHVSVQSHTLTHCVLSELSDTEAMYELVESRNRLEKIVGLPVRHIAIPRAGHSRLVRRLVGEAGYLTACGNRKGTANLESDMLSLPRIVIERDMTLSQFANCLSPRGALILRLIGEVKRVPERVGGARVARVLRHFVQATPLRHLLVTRNLKIMLATSVLAYAVAVGCYLSWLLGII